MNNEQPDIDNLIIRSLTGEASHAEEQQLHTWIAASPENDQYYQQVRKATLLTDQYYRTKQELPEVNLDAEWNSFLIGVGETKKNNVRTLIPTTLWIRVAAAVAFVVASGILYTYFLKTPELIVVETAAFTQEVTLPDGSRITLNQNSKLTYQPTFNKTNRDITLQGEAFFEVVHDASKPFVVTVNEASVEVLGTSFNIRAYKTDAELEVVVATGKVKLSAPDKTEQVMLQAGQRGVYNPNKNSLTTQVNNDVNFVAWKTGKLVFTETSLQAVIETLQKVYNTDIVISTEIPDTCLVTVSFDKQELTAVLNVLKSTLNLEYKIEAGKVEITHAGC